jgi:serine/threonine-protein kinase
MTPERWKQLKQLYAEAAEADGARREAILASADPDLADLYHRLLAAGESEGFLDHPLQVFEAPSLGLQPMPAFSAGDVLCDRFQIVRFIASGGMGEVYEAYDSGLREAVALKTVRASAANKQTSNAFRREVRRARAVTSHHVCRVHDLFMHQTDPSEPPVLFLSMRLLNGETLAGRIQRGGKLSPGQALPLLRDIAEGIDAAHREHIVHGDLKSGNVMLTSDTNGQVSACITDFGLARRIAHAAQETDTITEDAPRGGTPAWMAPEQVEGRPPGPEADIYAIGLIAYEMVTGRLPFDGETPEEIARRRLTESPQPARRFTPQLASEWEDALTRCLDRNPAKRFPTAASFVEAIASGRPPVDVLAGALAGGQIPEIDESRPTTKPPSALFVKRLSLWIGAVTLAVIVLFIFYRSRPVTQTVAVLPFQNQGGDPEMVYISEGVTSALISDLSRIPPLHVIGHAAVIRYEKGRPDALTAGRELHADRIIVGSVARLGNVLRVEAELIDVASGNRLWGRTYTRAISSLSNTLEEFSTEVTDQLRLKLAGALKDRLKRQYATGSESYQEYFKGQFYLNKRPEAFAEATEHFEKAVAIDPAYAPAYAGLAEVYDKMAFFGIARGGTTPSAALEKSRNAAQRALELDGTLAQAYSSLGWVEVQGEYRWEDAEKNFLRSIELNPNSEDAHEYYAIELTALGRFNEALREIKTAEELAPGLPNFRAAHGVIAMHARRYDESLAILSPITGSIKDSGTLAYLVSRDYWAQSRPAEALAALERLPDGVSPDFRVPLLAAAYARAGQRERAKALLDGYVVRPAGAAWYDLMLAHLALRRRSDAIVDLENAREERSQEIIFLGVDPLIDELRAEQGFNALLVRINLARKHGL